MSYGRVPERWQIHGERSIYDSRWMQVALVDAEPPGGERLERHVVRLARVAVAAIFDELDRVLMIWRYRFVPDRFGWELPGGIVEAGESAEAAAARETEEETGWRPVRQLRHLLSFQPMVGMVDSPHELFTGRGAEHVSAPSQDADEIARIAWIPLAEIPSMIERDELLGAGTLVALLYILAARRNHPDASPAT
jgi:8-oxo-dGTP pyrophosphatase MutT (NUDIX family)